MKKITTLLFTTLFFASLLPNALAQHQREVIWFSAAQFKASQTGSKTLELASKIPFQHRTGQFLAVSVVWFVDDWVEGRDQLSIDFKQHDLTLQGLDILKDGHAEQATNKHISELMFLEVDATIFSIQWVGEQVPDSIAVHFFDPGVSQKPPTLIQEPTPSDRSACTCPQPVFQGRLDWCPDGSCPPDPTPAFVPNPTHVIIHHTAGTNISADWAAVVRSVWDFHVNVNLWDDVGYNWLIDPNGVLYEGRGDGKLGAHFCAQNGATTGICVMGDFTNIQPSPDALNALTDFLAWETCDEDIDPLGTSFHAGSGLTLMNISGHRDGCNTSCPGDMFYPLLPGVRLETQSKIENGCDQLVLPGPTVLAITFVGPIKISLTWQDNALGETGYAIERSENTDDNFSQIVQLPANASAFSDNSVTPGLTYFYRVRAKQGSTFSDYSNVAVAVTAPSATESVLLNDRTVQIFPNPTNGFVTLNIDNQWFGVTELSAFDAMGREVIAPILEEKASKKCSFQLDFSAIPSGTVLVKMVQGTDVGWLKVVKN